jgi:hypothetical protein
MMDITLPRFRAPFCFLFASVHFKLSLHPEHFVPAAVVWFWVLLTRSSKSHPRCTAYERTWTTLIRSSTRLWRVCSRCLQVTQPYCSPDARACSDGHVHAVGAVSRCAAAAFANLSPRPLLLLLPLLLQSRTTSSIISFISATNSRPRHSRQNPACWLA